MHERNIQLGVFDIDGTIRSEKRISPEIVEGFHHLWENNVTTTVVTGRGYSRVREILDPFYNTLVSSHAAIALENGGRITPKEGNSNTLYYPLSHDEITDTFLTLEQFPDYDFVAYYPEKMGAKTIIWTPQKEYGEKMKQEVSHFADVVSISFPELIKQMSSDNPCMIMIKPHDRAYINELVQKGLNCSFNEGEINLNREGINKASAVNSIASVLDVPLKHTLVAGNDHNDLPMLNMGAGETVVVGNAVAGFITIPFKQIANASDLGKFLSTL